jgi:hypothetical protein
MGANCIPPVWWVPAAVVITGGWLCAPASDRAIRFPRPGSWRSLAETDPTDPQQIEAVATKFGPLTVPGATAEGELLAVWEQVIGALQPLAAAWTADGDAQLSALVGPARLAAHKLQARILLDHQTAGGQFSVHAGGEWALNCLDMAAWWQLSAIRAVFDLAPMRRCRYCDGWFSLTGLRSDAGFCSPTHRSAFHQKRKSSAFWAEAV